MDVPLTAHRSERSRTMAHSRDRGNDGKKKRKKKEKQKIEVHDTLLHVRPKTPGTGSGT